MEAKTNYTPYVVGGIAAVGLVAYKLLQMQDVRNNVPGVILKKVKFSAKLSEGIKIAIQIAIPNQSKSKMKISQPNLNIVSRKGEAVEILAFSLPNQKTYEIEPLGITELDPIEIPIPFSAIIAQATQFKPKAIYDAIKAGKKEKVAEALGIKLYAEPSLYANGLRFKLDTIPII